MASTESIQDRTVEGQTPGVRRFSKRASPIAVVVLITLLAGGSMVARKRVGASAPTQTNTVKVEPGNRQDVTQTTAGKVEPGNHRDVSPQSLTPSAPSKEYIRLGGKLVATEEPAP